MNVLNAFGNNEDRIDSILIKFKSEGVDTILIYKEGCVGCQVLFTDSNDCKFNSGYEEVYIFFQKMGSIYLKKLNECSLFFPIEVQNKEIFNFYFTNKNTFDEQIQFYNDLKDSIYSGKHIFLPPVPSHHDYNSISFYCPELEIGFKVIEEFEYDEKGNPKYLNYTWKKKQKEWADLIINVLNSIAKNKYKVEKIF